MRKYIQIASGIDVNNFQLSNKKKIWEVFIELKKLRNGHIHEFEIITREKIKIEYFELYDFFTNELLNKIQNNAGIRTT